MSLLVNDAYLTLQAYKPGKPVSETERELGLTGVVKLASNENPYGPSKRAINAMSCALGTLHEYPDGGAFYLREALARKHGVDMGNIIVGNGTNDLINMIVYAFLRPDENMLYTAPSFVMYKLAADSLGREVRAVPATSDLRHDLPALAAAACPKTKLIFIDNPLNPTGTYCTRKELETFFERIGPDVVVVLDEAYYEYAVAADFPCGLDYLGARARLIVLRTFSKVHGLAGLRVGYGVADAELVEYMNRGRQPFNVNALAQIAARAALDDDTHINMSIELNRQEMERLVPELVRRGLTVIESQANFVLVGCKRKGQEMFAALLSEGVIVRPLAAYGLGDMVRITIGSAEQNDRLLAALDRVLER